MGLLEKFFFTLKWICMKKPAFLLLIQLCAEVTLGAISSLVFMHGQA